MPFVCDTVGDLHIFPPAMSALSCSRGGFTFIRHNEIRDITADLLKEVCHCVGTEPSLQPVTGEHFEHRSANGEDGARLDIVA